VKIKSKVDFAPQNSDMTAEQIARELVISAPSCAEPSS
jgi:hypothetical protein